MIELSKDSVETHLNLFVDKLFSLPEVNCVKIKKMEIHRDNRSGLLKSAVDESYHDCYSDIDLCAVVQLAAGDKAVQDAYVKRIEHWGFPLEMMLGVCFVPQNSNVNWPVENIYRFWFVQIQALGKLYRDDFLISSHLANNNINETLVQQMVLRDLDYHTNHHRYGHKEELSYLKYAGQCPYQTGNLIFDNIADKIYAAALAYDELAASFYHDYEPKSKDFFAIWEAYERQGNR